jgi:hypothetical protein
MHQSDLDSEAASERPSEAIGLHAIVQLDDLLHAIIIQRPLRTVSARPGINSDLSLRTFVRAFGTYLMREPINVTEADQADEGVNLADEGANQADEGTNQPGRQRGQRNRPSGSRRGNQRQLEAIRGNQRQSEAIRGQSTRPSGSRREAVEERGNLRPFKDFEAIRGNQRLSEAYGRHAALSMSPSRPAARA